MLLKSQAERCNEIYKTFKKSLKLKDKFLDKIKITDLINIILKNLTKIKS